MKTLLLLVALLLTASCAPGAGFRLVNLPNAGVATMKDFAYTPPDYQMRYVAQIASVAQQNGIRCKPGSNITNSSVYYEMMTRLNAGKYNGTENLVREQFNVMNDLGCN